MADKIMAHLVAYYPDREASLGIAKALIQGGAGFLEIQFPFSDPTADGATIQEACTTALMSGFKVEKGFELVKRITERTDIPVFIMSYCNLVYTRGIKNFLSDTKKAGARGLIVPDLPFDTDEGLYAEARAMELEVIPVIAPTIDDKRLKGIADLGTAYLYTALRKGITGAFTEIGDENIQFLNKCGSFGLKVLAGFGISAREQIEKIAPFVHAVIVGSAFIREIQAHLDDGSYCDAVLAKMKKLAGC
ncbi:MAG: tryptophan synthase subunit alpha [Spirochaetales bacterium]|nr:tryptophan synthase subunit alpha [Spirochaetales bacterium]